MELDDRGIPVVPEGATSAPHAPDQPCQLCAKGTPANGQDPWGWCKEVDTCAATIDWDRVFGGS